jgi:hypothetical protein
MQPGEAYWNIIVPYWKTVDIYSGGSAFLQTFARLPKPVGHLLALHRCQSEVCNGGFHQFFNNSTGVLAPEAEEGFHAVRMGAAAEIVAKAMLVFGTPYPRDQEHRQGFLASIPGQARKEWDPFVALDSAFYEAIGQNGNLVTQAADAYALQIAK